MDFSIKFRTKGDVVLERTLLAKGDVAMKRTLLAQVIHCGRRPQPQRKKKKKQIMKN